MPTDADLIDPDTPLGELPQAPQIVGHFPDPDAQVLDDQVESQAEPPTPDKLPVTPYIAPVPAKKLTRLLTGSIAQQAAWPPTLLLSTDQNRHHIRIRVSSATPADFIRLSDDPGKIQALNGSALLYNTNNVFEIPGHTGPVWIYCPDAVGPVTISYMAVTE